MATDDVDKIRVIKFGGSLIEFPPAQCWLHGFLSSFGGQSILICGGGKAVNAIRSGQRKLGLTDRQAHWKSVNIMDRNTRWLAGSLGIPLSAHLQTQTNSSGTNTDSGCFGFLCFNWLRDQRKVPESWGVSSDSIAALVAGGLQNPGGDAVELVLLKSRLPEIAPDCRLAAATEMMVESGFVDSYFSTAFCEARLKRLRIIDVRKPQLPLQLQP